MPETIHSLLPRHCAMCGADWPDDDRTGPCRKCGVGLSCRADTTDSVAPDPPCISESITMKKGLTGAKPEKFCRWVLDLLGYVDGDELVDLYPGTGVMGRVLDQGRLAV